MRRTVIQRSSHLLIAIMPLAIALPARAAEGDSPLKISGFISTTLYAQDRAFGPSSGQGAWFPAVGPRGDDPWFFDGDVRNTRLTVSYAEPTTEGPSFGGVIQADFFGGMGASALTGDEQPIPRLRLAYAEMKLGQTSVRVGQDWSPLFGNTAKSLSHVAFPLGYGSGGKLGWRYPGIFISHKLTDGESPLSAKAQLAVMRGSWGTMAAQAGLPQVELRLDVGSAAKAATKWNVYLAGHFDQKDLSGAGAEADDDTLTGYAGQLGASLNIGPILLHGNAYYGRAIGQQFGQLLQLGDIAGYGAWAQIGYHITESLSAFIFYGMADPDDNDIADELLQDAVGQWIADSRAKERNTQLAIALHYTLGSFIIGAEYFRADLDHVAIDAAGNVNRGTAEGQQISLNVMYKF